jgi:glycosyltransferase involved in cell wall biosynthesis
MDHEPSMSTYGSTDLPEATRERPLVSFVVVAYNQEAYIRQAVEGALSQTYSPLEIILSDDCSPDRTFELMRELASLYRGPHLVKVRRNAQNSGLAGHINQAIAASSGEIISWAAGDDIAAPERTAVFVEALVADPSLVAVHSNITDIDLEGRPLGDRRRSAREVEITLDAVVRRGQSVITQSHAFRRAVFTRFGPFRDSLTHEGKAMAFREIVLGKVGYVDRCLTAYRVGSGISTYAGQDVTRKKSLEPIKYTTWFLSAFRQMLEDAGRLETPLPPETLEILRTNIRFYENLLRINRGEAIVSPLVRNLLIAPKDSRSLRAAVRSVAPVAVYQRLMR